MITPEGWVLIVGFGIVIAVFIIFFVNEHYRMKNEELEHEIRIRYNNYLLNTARINEARKKVLNKDPLLSLCEKYVAEDENGL